MTTDNNKPNNNKNNNKKHYNNSGYRKHYYPEISPETKARNQKVIKKVEDWQAFKFIKHLICPTEECATLLVAKEVNGRVILQCPKCKATQSYIPKSVLKTNFSISKTLIKLRSLYEWVVK